MQSHNNNLNDKSSERNITFGFNILKFTHTTLHYTHQNYLYFYGEGELNFCR